MPSCTLVSGLTALRSLEASGTTLPLTQHYVPDDLGLRHTYDVVPKVMRMIKKKLLLHIHAIVVYPLQNRLLVIEYNDSSDAATLHSNGGSLHLRCCSKPSSQLPGRFQLSQNDIL